MLLKNVTALKLADGRRTGYANSIADARTDLGEVSTKCLSYSNQQASVSLYSGGSGQQNSPLTPVLSPLTQYTNLFSNFVPTAASYADRGAAQAPAADAIADDLASKKSVLDFAMEEIDQLKGMVPNGGARASCRTSTTPSPAWRVAPVVDRLVVPVACSTGMGGTGGARRRGRQRGRQRRSRRRRRIPAAWPGGAAQAAARRSTGRAARAAAPAALQRRLHDQAGDARRTRRAPADYTTTGTATTARRHRIDRRLPSTTPLRASCTSTC